MTGSLGDADNAAAASAADLGGRKLLVRADASRAAGTGHVMRALALTQAWLDRGGHARWLLAEAPAALEARIAAEGVEIRRVEAPRASAADAQVLRSELERGERAAAAIDGLEFDAAYLRAIGPAAGRTLLLDDAADRQAYPVGIVLNQNAHADRGAYPADAGARFLLGTRFVVLRREFVPDPPDRPAPDRARSLLVTLGGADPGGVTARVLDALGALPDDLRRDADVRVVVGAANPEGARLEAAARRLEGTLRVSVLRGVTDMPALLAWADLAITSGGSTVWELARMGCPALVIETVPVESLLVGGLARVGLDDRLGHADRLEDATITAAVARRIVDRPWRAAMSALGRQLVDGRGAARVVDALAEVAGRA
jgi:UDP-2,4-diacetamido-2,4,6-trideoxy-beta-L-altropyranose hydrolase